MMIFTSKSTALEYLRVSSAKEVNIKVGKVLSVICAMTEIKAR